MTDEPVTDESTNEAPPEEPVVDATIEPTATVREVAGWHLVEYGTWEISVGPDGLLMLPRWLVPDEVVDFVACARAAADVGAQVRAENAERAKKTGGDGLPVGAAIVREGPPPPGAIRLPYSTMGRPKRTGRQARTPGHQEGKR